MTRCKNRTLVFTLLFGLFFWSELVIAKPIINLAQKSELSSNEAKRAEAERLDKEATQHYEQRTAKSYQQAILSWKQARDLYRELGDLQMEANILNNIGAFSGYLGQSEKALEYYEQAVSILREIGDSREEAATLAVMGVIYSYIRQPDKALNYYNQALPILRETKNYREDADTNTGVIYSYIGQPEKALNYYSQALPILRELGDSKREATTLSGMGTASRGMGQSTLAIDYHNQALPILRKVGDSKGEAATLNNLGNVYIGIGQPEQALQHYNRALNIWKKEEDFRGEATTLSGVGNVYIDIGQPKQALNYYERALDIWKKVKDSRGEATTLNGLGAIYSNLEQPEKALNYHDRALNIWAWKVFDSRGEATSLNNIGAIYSDLGESNEALSYYDQALIISREVKDSRGEATTLNNIGAIYSDLGESDEALSYYNRALIISREVKDSRGEATTLNNIAFLRKNQSNFIKALNYIEASVEVLETIREEITDSDLRTSYFASVNDSYQLYIEILMELHQQNPNDGYDKQALEVSEQARSRTLLELIKEGDIVRGIDPQLKQRKEDLERQVIAKTQAIRALAEKGQQEKIESIRQEISQLENQLEALETEIRQQNPEYARLTQVRLNLNAQDIQEKIVDDDTVLLSYWLGEEQSYLWLVTPNEITSYTLPPQAEIEQASEELLDYAQDGGKWDLSPKKASAANQKLSQILLAPIADLIGNKRLIVVADGGLQYLPFSLLENPQTQQSLVVSSEIVNVPSASTLDTIRNKNTQPPADRKEVAIFAHPVFTSDDPRLQNKSESTASETSETLDDLVRKQALKEAILNPLPGTEATAQQILAYIPNSDRKKLNLGFEANRQAIFDPNVSQYRLIHLGTHGLFNKEKPEHSGIVLSLYDEQGNYQADGMLLITEVFNLNLPADLVVLAACNTVEGEEIKGEGIVGITRGLMYAGASRVVMTLWDVDDDATTVFMDRFYQEMLENQLTPAAALRATQLWMQTESEYQAPDYWAGFVLQGEWQ